MATALSSESELRDPVTSFPLVSTAHLCSLFQCDNAQTLYRLLPPPASLEHSRLWRCFPDEDIEGYVECLTFLGGDGIAKAADHRSKHRAAHLTVRPSQGASEPTARHETCVPAILYAATITRHTMLSHVSEQLREKPVPIPAKIAAATGVAPTVVVPLAEEVQDSTLAKEKRELSIPQDASLPHYISASRADAVLETEVVDAQTSPQPQGQRWCYHSANNQRAQLLLSATHLYILPETDAQNTGAYGGHGGGIGGGTNRSAAPTLAEGAAHPHALAIPLAHIVKHTCLTSEPADGRAPAITAAPTLNMLWVRLPHADATPHSSHHGSARRGRGTHSGEVGRQGSPVEHAAGDGLHEDKEENNSGLGYFAFRIHRGVAGGADAVLQDGTHAEGTLVETLGRLLRALVFLPERKAAQMALPKPFPLATDPYGKWRELFEETMEEQCALAEALRVHGTRFTEVVPIGAQAGSMLTRADGSGGGGGATTHTPSQVPQGDAANASRARKNTADRKYVVVTDLENVSWTYRHSRDLNAPPSLPGALSPPGLAKASKSAAEDPIAVYRELPELHWVTTEDAANMSRVYDAVRHADRVAASTATESGVRTGGATSWEMEIPKPTRRTRSFARRLHGDSFDEGVATSACTSMDLSLLAALGLPIKEESQSATPPRQAWRSALLASATSETPTSTMAGGEHEGTSPFTPSPSRRTLIRSIRKVSQ